MAQLVIPMDREDILCIGSWGVSLVQLEGSQPGATPYIYSQILSCLFQFDRVPIRLKAPAVSLVSHSLRYSMLSYISRSSFFSSPPKLFFQAGKDMKTFFGYQRCQHYCDIYHRSLHTYTRLFYALQSTAIKSPPLFFFGKENRMNIQIQRDIFCQPVIPQPTIKKEEKWQSIKQA